MDSGVRGGSYSLIASKASCSELYTIPCALNSTTPFDKTILFGVWACRARVLAAVAERGRYSARAEHEKSPALAGRYSRLALIGVGEAADKGAGHPYALPSAAVAYMAACF